MAHSSVQTARTPANTRVDPGPTVRFADRQLDQARLHTWVLDTISEAVNVLDDRNTIVYANNASHAMHGYAPGELIGKPIAALRDAAPQEVAARQTRIREHIAVHGSWSGEFQNRRKDGSPFLTSARVSQLQGDRNYWVCVQRDITRERETEQAIQQVRQQFEELATMMDEVYWVCSPDRTQLYYLSPSFERIWDRPRAELFQNPRIFLEAIHPDDRPAVLADIECQRRGESCGYYQQEYRIIRPDGGVRWISTRYVSPRPGSNACHQVVGISADITERKLMEQALRDSSAELERRVADRTAELAKANARLRTELTERCRIEASLRESEATNRALLTAIPDLIFRLSRDGKYLAQVTTREVPTFHSPIEFLGKRVDEVLPPDVASVATAMIAATLESGALHCFECRLPTEVQRDYEVRLAPCAVDEVLAIVRDVTERKWAEERLRASERRLRDILDGIFVFVALLSPDGIILDINLAPLKAASMRREDVVGKHVWEMVGWAGMRELQLRVKEIVARAATGEIVRVDIPVKIHGDAMCTLDLSLSPILNGSGKVVQIVSCAVDITDRLHIQEELRRQRDELAHVLRLATAGEMATSIAHELNQPLTAIVTSAHVLRTILCRGGMAGDLRLISMANTIEDQATRAGEIIRGMREFVRKGKSRRAPSDINGVLGRVLNIIAADARLLGVCVETDFDDRLPPVSIDAVQIQQVVMNLARNALEAFKNGPCPEQKIRVKTQRYSSDFAVVEIADTGPGIAAEALETIFNAFSTTKSSGLGMGLAISRSIVESHGGKLWAESVLGQGATFRFTLSFEQRCEHGNGE